MNFYPRSPCGERHQLCEQAAIAAFISIHALLAESDGLSCPNPVSYQFLSTLSLRRATQIKQTCRAEIRFLSTLSLRRATDASKDTIKTVTNFYPRSPCGERPKLLPYQFASIPISIHALLAESDNSAFANKSIESGFLSTLSLRRATVHGLSHADDRGISIHALLAESDIVGTSQVFQRIAKPFLSTLSLRRATLKSSISTKSALFLSTLSLRRATDFRSLFAPRLLHFYPRSPCGERQ